MKSKKDETRRFIKMETQGRECESGNGKCSYFPVHGFDRDDIFHDAYICHLCGPLYKEPCRFSLSFMKVCFP